MAASLSIWYQGCRWGCGSPHLFVLVCLMSARLGEAQHPGPTECFLGALNPSGLSGKHGVVAQMSPGVYGVSETHLTARNVRLFNQGLHFAQSAFRLLPGSPAPLRPSSNVTGTHTGVGVLSSFPARPANHHWDADMWETARIQAVHAYVEPTWLLMVVAYGFASEPPAITNTLLAQLSCRIVDEAVGPRCLVGDFNLTSGQIQLWDYWKSKGFVEIQDLWAVRTGQVPRVTCKGCSRKDFLLLSPELAQWVTNVFVDESWFPDHALITARLHFPDAPIPRTVWHMPRVRPDQATVCIPALQHEGLMPLQNPTQHYQWIWSQFESRLSEAYAAGGSGPLTASEKGRAQVFDVKVVRDSQAPLRKSRHNEVAPRFLGENGRHAHWFRQLRRLQSLVQALQRPNPAPGAVLHRMEVWGAILRLLDFSRLCSLVADPCPEAFPGPSGSPAVCPGSCHSTGDHDVLRSQFSLL